MIEAWLARAANEFWKSIGETQNPPRDLTRIVSRRFPLGIVALAPLSINQIESWFFQRHVPYQFLCRNRMLYGCVVAARGHGLLFVDANDPDDQQRFTTAHEIAHFLLDYDAPRRTALDLFGEAIRPVLDGERMPTDEERIDAVLSNITLGIYVDMMPRGVQGDIDQGKILRAEIRADLFALELLAPAEEVFALLPAGISQPLDRVRTAIDVLVNVFGLPRQVARTYATHLLQRNSRLSTAQWLGI
jgi:hypothetical protein